MDGGGGLGLKSSRRGELSTGGSLAWECQSPPPRESSWLAPSRPLLASLLPLRPSGPWPRRGGAPLSGGGVVSVLGWGLASAILRALLWPIGRVEGRGLYPGFHRR